MIITIDGPAGTGKSTVAQGVAAKLCIPYFNTGAVYRALTWYVLTQKIADNNEKALLAATQDFCKKFHFREGRAWIDTVDVTEHLQTLTVTAHVSQISAIPSIRASLLVLQKDFAKAYGGGVFEGRDLGTVVFPEADFKIFLTATPEVRALRRLGDFRKNDPTISYEKVFEDIKARDARDSTRKTAPLKQAPDAHLIDTSHLTAEEVIDKITTLCKKK